MIHTMNAKFLERLITYRQIHRIAFARMILDQKIKNQFSIIGYRQIGREYREQLYTTESVETLLLIEARAARRYWKQYGTLIEKKIPWQNRLARGKDSANTLLDIGYHYLSQRIASLCDDIHFPTEIGFFHKARSFDSRPFVYDYMEWLRPVCVDAVLLNFAGKKKKLFLKVKQKDIKRFIYLIKKNFNTNYYHRKLGYCITLEYWMRLVL